MNVIDAGGLGKRYGHTWALRECTLAIAAGYLGLFSLIPFFAPIALIVSIIAIVQLRRNPQLHGMGRAIFGLVTGILGTGFIVVMIVTLAMGR